MGVLRCPGGSVSMAQAALYTSDFAWSICSITFTSGCFTAWKTRAVELPAGTYVFNRGL